jgi:hypothetical protein
MRRHSRPPSIARRFAARSCLAILAVVLATDVFARLGSRWVGTAAFAAAADPPGLSALYPGDAGIENDPAVVFVERFEETSTANVFSRWTDVLNGPGMSLATDVPAGSPGTRSLNIPWTGGGVSNGGHLYKTLTPGIDDTLHVRYYVKYPTNGQFSHNGIWMGGYNPALNWPNPQAGVKPVGNDRFSAAAEQAHTTAQFDHYDYWMNMRVSNDGSYWGNELLNNPLVTGRTGQWMCVEHMVKLNNPVTSSNGEHAIWLDGVKVSHLGQGFPNGSWAGGNFNPDPSGTPFEGFRWRSDANLKLNWIWLQNYAPYDPAGFSSTMRFDHVVVARSYIGCLASQTIPAPAPPTNLRIVTGSGNPPPVATVAVTPAITSVLKSATQQLTATLKDASGNVLTGRTVAWSSSNIGVASVSASGLVTGVAAGVVTVTATSEGKSGTSAVTITALSGAAWPSEPAGMTGLTSQPWDILTGNGWNYLRRSATQDSSIVTDAALPFSASKALKITYTAGCCIDAEPGVHWFNVGGVKEIFTGYWVKLSPNWIPNPAGGGKISFLFTDVGGQVYVNFYNQTDDNTVQGPPYRIGVNTEWAPYGQRIWLPNVATKWINNGEWHRVEVYYKWETTPGVSSDGIIRWWVDGQLNGDHRNVHYPAAKFQEFQIAPTVQYAGPQDRYMYFDHTYISGK